MTRTQKGATMKQSISELIAQIRIGCLRIADELDRASYDICDDAIIDLDHGASRIAADAETLAKQARELASLTVKLSNEPLERLSQRIAQKCASGSGVPIGVNDRHGNPIHIGDKLRFDEEEFGQPCEFVIELKDGEIQHNGGTSDLTNWCEIIQSWNER